MVFWETPPPGQKNPTRQRRDRTGKWDLQPPPTIQAVFDSLPEDAAGAGAGEVVEDTGAAAEEVSVDVLSRQKTQPLRNFPSGHNP